MNIDLVSGVLTTRFRALGAIDGVSFAERALAVVRLWLTEVVELPPKSVVLSATDEAIDNAFAGIDTPGPDVIVEPILKSAILALVAFAYDQLAGDSVDGGVSV